MSIEYSGEATNPFGNNEAFDHAVERLELAQTGFLYAVAQWHGSEGTQDEYKARAFIALHADRVTENFRSTTQICLSRGDLEYDDKIHCLSWLLIHTDTQRVTFYEALEPHADVSPLDDYTKIEDSIQVIVEDSQTFDEATEHIVEAFVNNLSEDTKQVITAKQKRSKLPTNRLQRLNEKLQGKLLTISSVVIAAGTVALYYAQSPSDQD